MQLISVSDVKPPSAQQRDVSVRHMLSRSNMLLLVMWVCIVWMMQLPTVESSTRHRRSIPYVHSSSSSSLSSRKHTTTATGTGTGTGGMLPVLQVQEQQQDTGSSDSDDDRNYVNAHDDESDDMDELELIPATWILDSKRSSSSFSNGGTSRTYDGIDSIDDDAAVAVTDDQIQQLEMKNVNVQPPQINIPDMTSVLRYTSMLNAQLQQVCRDSSSTRTTYSSSSSNAFVSPPRAPVKALPIIHDHVQRGGGGAMRIDQGPYRIRHHTDDLLSTLWPTSTSSNIDTAFYSTEPIDQLQDFLSRVMDALVQNGDGKSDSNVDDDVESDEVYTTSLERTLMMLYLDRACSSSGCRTTTSHNGYDHNHVTLPFCTPTSVHYLCVTALLVATGAVRGDLLSLVSDNNDSSISSSSSSSQSPFMQSLYHKLETVMGIPAVDSQYRVSLMLQALNVRQQRGGQHSTISSMDIDMGGYGEEEEEDDDSGIFVSPSAMLEWKDKWETRFTV